MEALYATLTAWGLHRMGPGDAKLGDFGDFKAAFRRHAEAICDLASLRIDELADEKVQSVGARLWELIADLGIGPAERKIVRGSKALHHLLPDLLPPIDGEHTLKFFFQNPAFDEEKERAAFREMYPCFRRVSTACASQIRARLSGPGEWNTSITKIIDNAIVGYVRGREGV